jgi:hypothetical protein
MPMERKMTNQFDLKKALAYLDEQKKKEIASKAAKKNPRTEEDARMIEQLFVARGELPTGWLVGYLVDCLGVPKDRAKTRVSAVLRLLLAEGRIRKVKQGIYVPATH